MILLLILIVSIMKIPIPIVITKEGAWFVASSPVLDIATQGKTEDEVKDNMSELISDYMSDPDTPKPQMSAVMEISISNIPVDIPEDVLNRKTSHAATR